VKIETSTVGGVADPGSGAFLTPGSGIRDELKIRIRIRDEQLGSFARA